MSSNHKRSNLPAATDEIYNAEPVQVDEDRVPYAEDSSWKPSDPEDLRAQFVQVRGDLPDLKPQQYQAMEMILDYLTAARHPVIESMARKLGLSNWTLRQWVFNDPKFREFRDKIIGGEIRNDVIEALSILVKRNKKNPSSQFTMFAAKWLGLLDTPPPEPEISKRAHPEVDEATGIITWIFDRVD